MIIPLSTLGNEMVSPSYRYIFVTPILAKRWCITVMGDIFTRLYRHSITIHVLQYNGAIEKSI